MRSQVLAMAGALAIVLSTVSIEQSGPWAAKGGPGSTTVPNTNSTRVIVGWKANIPPNDTRIQDYCGVVNTTQNELLFTVVTITSGHTQTGCVNQLRTYSDIRYAVPDGYLRPLFVPNDPLYNDFQWDMRQIRAEAAWDITQSSPVRIGVIDTGAFCTHPDLVVNCNPVAPAVSADDCGHGTHVAGTIAAGLNNGLYVAGLQNVEIRPYLALPIVFPGAGCGHGLISLGALAIMQAKDAGMKIISMSWGAVDPTCAGDPLGPFCTPLEDAIKSASDAGILLIAAAGNEGEGDGHMFYPALYSQVIAVSSTNEADVRSSFSSYGTKVEISAPGSNITSTMAPGAYYEDCNPEPCKCPRLGLTCMLNGTSMATPHVAGVAAMIWAKCIFLSRDTVRSILQSGTTDLGSPGRDPDFGFGRIDAKKALDLTPGQGQAGCHI